MHRFRLSVLCLVIITAGCTSNTDPALDADSSPSTDDEVTPSTQVQNDQADATPPELAGLPDGYDLASAGLAIRPVPIGSTAVRTVAVVGSSPADPRFIEYTLFDLNDPGAATSTTELVDLVGDEVVVDLTSGEFAFLTGDSTPIPDRSDLDLLGHGPSVNATFRAVVEDDLVVVGGSANLQTAVIDDLIGVLSVDEVPGSNQLPPQMSVLVDGVLPDGRFVDLSSTHGTTSIVVYDDVGREWFDYFTWGDPDVPLPAEMADLASEVSLQPVTNYGIGGAAVDPVRFSFWSNNRLTIVEHPESVADDEALAIAALMVDETSFDDLVATATALGPESGEADDDAAPDGSTSQPPSEQNMAAFQQYVETRLGVEYSRPMSFNYVPDFPTDGFDFAFISSDLWLVATALGLTDDGQNLDGANQARLDAVRGTPGTIALQPTQTETDVVTVHEMVHLLDFDTAEVASAEPFSMSQVVSEGNAHRIAYDYLKTLDEPAQAIMEPFPHIFPDDGDPRISRAVQDLLEFPYDEGRLFMAAAAEDGGQPRVAGVFQRPPVSTEQVLFYDAWLRNDQPTTVPAPDLPRGASALGEGTLGVYLLLLVATDVDSAEQGREALQQWSGDSYVLYEKGGETCIDAVVAFDSPQAASDLGDILRETAESIDVDEETVRASFCS